MNLMQIFSSAKIVEMNDKDAIVQRLLDSKAITAHEATLLLKSVDINLNVQNMEMSSGAKIIGGSYTETNDR